MVRLSLEGSPLPYFEISAMHSAGNIARAYKKTGSTGTQIAILYSAYPPELNHLFLWGFLWFLNVGMSVGTKVIVNKGPHTMGL